MTNADKALEAIEVARTTGKIRKGSNEVTKAIERGHAKLVVVAQDVTPKEIVMHIPLLAKEKGVLCVEVPSKDNLGASAGLEVGTAAVVIVQEGDAKKVIEELKTLKKQYNIQGVQFEDDNMTADRERAIKIMKLMIEENLNLKIPLFIIKERLWGK